MANQFNRLNYVLGKGGFIRLIWKPNPLVETTSLVILPHSVYTFESDPGLEDMTEADSLGRYFAPSLANYMIRVDLRRRQTVMSLDALGIRGINFVDRVLLDIGTTGTCDIIDHMAVGPYNRNHPQTQHVQEGFSLQGGQLTASGIAIPTYALSAGTIPDISAYSATGSVPTGL